MRWLIAFSVCILLGEIGAVDKIICYYESWSAYKDFTPEKLNPSLCTHINYAFIGVQSDGNLKTNDQNLDVDKGLYKRVTDLKKKNKKLKVLLSVGGASADAAAAFSTIAASSDKRKKFLNSAKTFIKKYNFDGLDLDWELPQAKDKANFITLLKELRSSFDKEKWLLTAAVSAEPGAGYDVKQVNKYLHWINVMTYDMYGSWSKYTGQNSPLFASSVESDWEKQNLNLAAAMNQWKKAGASASKLVAGLAFYGRSFTLQDASKHGIHAPVSGVGPGENGVLYYHEICKSYGGWKRVWDNEQKNPYKYQDNKWFGYDDEQSIQNKIDYIKKQKFGGVMMWSVNGDDVMGSCGQKQVLLKKINKSLGL